MTLNEYRTQYPLQTLTLKSGKPFSFRYAKHPSSKKTLVLLTGGIGFSDLFYLHFEYFSRNFSVLTFDYQMPFESIGEFSASVSELLQSLHIKAWLVGQSLGGIIAQIIARNHPDIVSGLVLSNTCSLSKDMNASAESNLMAMLKDCERVKKLLPFIPFGLYKRLVKQMVMKKKTGDFTPEEKQVMAVICDAIVELMNRPYEAHMIDFLMDAKNHIGMEKKHFEYLKDRVLLILSEDDTTFNDDCKQALIELMPSPQVVTDLTGGHLALLIRLERYGQLVESFIASHPSGS